MTRLPSVRLASDQAADVLGARLRDDEWERIGHGVYLPRGGDPQVDPARRRALALVEGVRRRSSAPVVFSHTSAAALWGLALWRQVETVHLYHPSCAGGERDRSPSRHHGLPPDEEVGTVAGVRATSLERTLVDCARLLPPLPALVTADSALAAGADPVLVEEILRRMAGGRHVRRAREVLRYADAGAESPYESASRFVVLRDGLPVPQTQVPVETRLGVFWADWGWPDLRILAEYDGRTKYTSGAIDAFMAEKRRHDAVVEQGHRVLRVVREDIWGTTLSRRLSPLLPAAVRAAISPRAGLRS
ncbi:hypothetical protein KIN34_02645 [Cellulomonas sp. DKR-3]|uniref:Transcriptional regulator, AbiEi antitoxin, Type IV TA system n=1 Tax=Cellulomonas fulva TaxID=2835530 RepID=A0ABS5TVL9_9CELL|nr:hypothetical protein [Cellulomonas fulva]MBT0993188.1 hypothetical protein [Cellulomonas fulva]